MGTAGQKQEDEEQEEIDNRTVEEQDLITVTDAIHEEHSRKGRARRRRKRQ